MCTEAEILWTTHRIGIIWTKLQRYICGHLRSIIDAQQSMIAISDGARTREVISDQEKQSNVPGGKNRAGF
jgi:hypothetical protein